MAGAPHTKAFFADCEHWLAPYAHYCYLRDFYGTCVFSEWPDHKQWNEADRKALSNPKSELYNKVAFYYYMQFVLDQQMRSAHAKQPAAALPWLTEKRLDVWTHNKTIQKAVESYRIPPEQKQALRALRIRSQKLCEERRV